jgi:hypothetical protein
MRIVFDKYMLAARWLSENPERINDSWGVAGSREETPGSPLFRQAGDRWCGCLTQIRGGWRGSLGAAATPELTADILADERIPASERAITLDKLNVFVEWQRRLDAELGEDRNG